MWGRHMTAELPHDRVWARLGVSTRHGVGVFAIAPIPRGTDVFASDEGEIIWVQAAEADALPDGSEQKRLYRDFAVRRGSVLGCPVNFNMLSVGWYVNEPLAGEQANLSVADDLAMVAVRDIAAGEELTVTYATFSK